MKTGGNPHMSFSSEKMITQLEASEVTTPEMLPVYVVACKVFQLLLEQHLPEGLAQQITIMDYGLHEFPKQLKSALQDVIDSINEPGLIVLGYGLCGNGLNGIKAGRHTLLIPRADDCIAILLGSYEAYKREFEATPGTYYLTKGWLESGSNPLEEYQGYVEKYGPERAEFVMNAMYQNYERLVFVAHDQDDFKKYRSQVKEIARFCERFGMRYEEILGSDGYFRRLLEMASRFDEADEDFLLIPPGGEIRQDQFLRV